MIPSQIERNHYGILELLSIIEYHGINYVMKLIEGRKLTLISFLSFDSIVTKLKRIRKNSTANIYIRFQTIQFVNFLSCSLRIHATIISAIYLINYERTKKTDGI